MKIKKRTENVNNNRQRLIFRGKINKSNTSLIIWLIFALLIVLIAVLADVIVPYDPYEQDLSAALMPPDSHHLLELTSMGVICYHASLKEQEYRCHHHLHLL